MMLTLSAWFCIQQLIVTVTEYCYQLLNGTNLRNFKTLCSFCAMADLVKICCYNFHFRQSRRVTWREPRYMLRTLSDRRIKLWIIGEWALVLMPSQLAFRLPLPPNRLVFLFWCCLFQIANTGIWNLKPVIIDVCACVCVVQVTSSMAGVVKAMESAMKSMNLEKVIIVIIVVITIIVVIFVCVLVKLTAALKCNL